MTRKEIHERSVAKKIANARTRLQDILTTTTGQKGYMYVFSDQLGNKFCSVGGNYGLFYVSPTLMARIGRYAQVCGIIPEVLDKPRILEYDLNNNMFRWVGYIDNRMADKSLGYHNGVYWNGVRYYGHFYPFYRKPIPDGREHDPLWRFCLDPELK